MTMTHDQWRLIAALAEWEWVRLHEAVDYSDSPEQAELLRALQRLEECQAEIWKMLDETRTEER